MHYPIERIAYHGLCYTSTGEWLEHRTKAHTKNVFRDQISLATDYNEFTNEIPFVGDILQLEPIFTAAEIQAKKDLAGNSEQ